MSTVVQQLTLRLGLVATDARLAKQFGISDVALAKAVVEPQSFPNVGYWAKSQARQKGDLDPLPPGGPGMSNDVFVGADAITV